MKKCLIIDDDRNFCNMMEETMHLRDFDVVDVRFKPQDGIQAAITTKSYDIIFIDFDFGPNAQMNGAAIGIEIRKECP